MCFKGQLQAMHRSDTACQGHVNTLGSHLGDSAVDVVGLAGGLGGGLLDGALKTVVPGLHGDHFLAGQQPPQIGHDVARVVVGDVCAPARADALCAVHQHHGQNGQVPAHGPGAQVHFCTNMQDRALATLRLNLHSCEKVPLSARTSLATMYWIHQHVLNHFPGLRF